MMVYAKLNQGIDSFVRVASFLRRKEFNVKAINMHSGDDSEIDVNIIFGDNYSINSVISYISKLEDVKEIKVL